MLSYMFRFRVVVGFQRCPVYVQTNVAFHWNGLETTKPRGLRKYACLSPNEFSCPKTKYVGL